MKVQVQNQTQTAASQKPKLTPVANATLGNSTLEHVPDSFAGSLREGQKLTFEFADGRKFVLEGAPGFRPKGGLSGVTDFIQSAAQELQVAVNAGPSLALTGITELVKPVLMNGVSGDVGSQVEQWYTPAVRGVSICLSMEKFLIGWHRAHAKRDLGIEMTSMDYLGMAANGLHVVTSAVGLAGALAGAISPALHHLGMIGKGVGLAGDAGAFAVNLMQYTNDRSRIINIDSWEGDDAPVPVPTPPPPVPAPKTH